MIESMVRRLLPALAAASLGVVLSACGGATVDAEDPAQSAALSQGNDGETAAQDGEKAKPKKEHKKKGHHGPGTHCDHDGGPPGPPPGGEGGHPPPPPGGKPPPPPPGAGGPPPPPPNGAPPPPPPGDHDDDGDDD